MRIKIYISTLIFLLSFSVFSFAQNAEKILVKSFNLHGSQIVKLNLDAPVEVQTWNGDVMRIQITIGLPNGSEAMLKSLITAGRYNLTSSEDGDSYIVNAPGLEREVVFRGNPLEEKISYQVFAPKDVVVKLPNEASTQSDLADEPSAL